MDSKVLDKLDGFVNLLGVVDVAGVQMKFAQVLFIVISYKTFHIFVPKVCQQYKKLIACR